jgi:hypothetical protein
MSKELKVNKKTAIGGSIIIVAILAYLYYRRKKALSTLGTATSTEESSSGGGGGGGFMGGLPPFIQSILPSSEPAKSATTSTPSSQPIGTSQVTNVPEVTPVVKSPTDADLKAQADALAKQQADALAKQQADALAVKISQAESISRKIYELRNTKAYTPEQINQQSRDISRLSQQIRALGYVNVGNGGIQPI